MKISDNYEVKDCEYKPVGIVRLIDKDGNVIFQKHNMVVNDGRLLMFNLFLKCFSLIEDYTEPNDLHVRLSYDVTGSQTVANLDYNNVINNENKNSNNETLMEEITINPSSTDQYAIKNDDRSITFKYSISSTNEKLQQYEYFKFNQVFIYYTVPRAGNIDAENMLFSRVALDPVFLTIGQEYNLEYTLYF